MLDRPLPLSPCPCGLLGEAARKIPAGNELPVQDSIDRGLLSPDRGPDLFLGQAGIKERPNGV